MKKFIFEDCNGNVGQEKIFDSEEKAVNYAVGVWAHLTEHEKKRYIDQDAWFRLYEVELTAEQLEEYEEEGGIDDKPLTEYETRTIIDK